MTYSVIGTGGIGGYYGGRLALAGHDVHFLLHSDYDYVKEHGLRVDSVNGDFHLPSPQVYDDAQKMPVSDVVLVCLKTTQNDLLPNLLRKVVGKDTVVVLIQNGIGVEEDVQKMLPDIQLVAGIAFIGTTKTAPGHINHQCLGSINLANYSCNDEVRIKQIANDFTDSGIPATLAEYNEARWKKALLNMTTNGLSVILNAQSDKLINDPAISQLIREQMMEIVHATEHMGIHSVDEKFVEQLISMTENTAPYSPSMKVDYDHHRPMEIKYIYTRPLEIARAAGMPMPKLEVLEAELRFLENRNINQSKNV